MSQVMIQPSAPPPASSSPTPTGARNQKSNRKSGITAGLQAQGQNQGHSKGNQNQGNQNLNQGRSNNNNRQRQSMPAQQRTNNQKGQNNNNNKTITILKRNSDPSLAPSSSTTTTATVPTPIPQPKQPQQPHQQQQQQQRNRNQRQRPQSHNPSNTTPSKARRVHQRKDIEATTASLAKVDQDLAMDQSPPLQSASPLSSSDSDDSESTRAKAPAFLLSSSPPQRPNSAPAVPQSRKGMAAATNRNQHNARPTAPMPTADRPVNGKAHSADKVMLAERVATEKGILYAGPTFHNSPAPTSLPIPAFTRSLGNSPVEAGVETMAAMPSPFFAEAASPQLNSMRTRTQSETTGWMGHHHQSMPALPNHLHRHQHHNSMDHHLQQRFVPQGMYMGYNVPNRMATSSYSLNELGAGSPPPPRVGELMEISHNLRTLLKIQSQ